MVLIRLFYAIEFLVALIAVYAVWSQAGGQGHLDMMAWYWKLFLGVALAFACVKATAAAVSNKRPWNARTIKWVSIVLALMLACGAVTYYYHLTEPPSDEEDTTPSQTSAQVADPGVDWLSPASRSRWTASNTPLTNWTDSSFE